MKYTHNCLWSLLEITIKNFDNDKIIKNCFNIINLFEAKYSRFVKWNFLHNLNNKKSSEVDLEFFSLIKLCLEVSKITSWSFDITVLPILENRGYWIKNKIVKENIWYKNIILNKEKIMLQNWIEIDLWSVWKWYLVDKIYKILDKYSDNFIINFGWDIRVKWKETIWLEDPINLGKIIWNIEILNWSIASSSWNRRKISKWHHLINLKNKHEQNDKITVYITHKLATFADIFSTALFVTPIQESIKILWKIKWLEWMIISKEWEIFKSRWFNCSLIWTK